MMSPAERTYISAYLPSARLNVCFKKRGYQKFVTRNHPHDAAAEPIRPAEKQPHQTLNSIKASTLNSMPSNRGTQKGVSEPYFWILCKRLTSFVFPRVIRSIRATHVVAAMTRLWKVVQSLRGLKLHDIPLHTCRKQVIVASLYIEEPTSKALTSATHSAAARAGIDGAFASGEFVDDVVELSVNLPHLADDQH